MHLFYWFDIPSDACFNHSQIPSLQQGPRIPKVMDANPREWEEEGDLHTF